MRAVMSDSGSRCRLWESMLGGAYDLLVRLGIAMALTIASDGLVVAPNRLNRKVTPVNRRICMISPTEKVPREYLTSWLANRMPPITNRAAMPVI